MCEDCVAELFDPADRRYRHPFITCTNCGPRFTIIKALPYDRPATTMSAFAMCERCAAEYHDPANRRFHAQPIACPGCGPSLWFSYSGRRIDGADAALAATQQALAAGAIVAVKGIGGYHLACIVDDETAVARLRTRKARGAKPFAMLVRDLEVAGRYAQIEPTEAEILASPAALSCYCGGVRTRRSPTPSHRVTAAGADVAVLADPSPAARARPGAEAPVPDALVLTSANRSDEPICFTEDDAAQRLSPLCDAVLDHNRPIHVPCDDSVVRVVDGHELPIRRSRGYAPLPVDLGRDAPAVLAVGGELKNTFCLTDGSRAFMSGHIGDMATLETLRAFERAVTQLSEIRQHPVRLAADLHPGYQTRGWAERHTGDRPLDLVQHHHAHVVSLLAEQGRLGEPIIGVSFDGTGYGSDGTIWGGEILAIGPDSHRFTRVGHLLPVPLPGGDAAVRNPWRMALSELWMAGIEWTRIWPGGSGDACRAARHPLAIGNERGMCAVFEHGAAVRRGGLAVGRAAANRLRGPGRHRTRGAGRNGGRADRAVAGGAPRRGNRPARHGPCDRVDAARRGEPGRSRGRLSPSCRGRGRGCGRADRGRRAVGGPYRRGVPERVAADFMPKSAAKDRI
ncbi:carbamoyltransferase HypF [Mycobacterium xenopi 4042]|uniref:Carbamoyltransferase HypF n=1 Tax=Mycobacterium xenopi 4042 TaxID=1299334 RepID=X7Z4Q9_MYCXE|nr:carbamoyltransferase HypF [Mycobacterium xenopi 4042]